MSLVLHHNVERECQGNCRTEGRTRSIADDVSLEAVVSGESRLVDGPQDRGILILKSLHRNEKDVVVEVSDIMYRMILRIDLAIHYK